MDSKKGKISIRKATEADIPFMGVLWAMLVIEENETAKPQIMLWMNSRRKIMKDPSYYAYVTVEDDKKIVGFADGSVNISFDSGEIYVEGLNMFVLPEYRKGKAGMLIHRMGIDLVKRTGGKFFRRHVTAGNERMMKRLLRGNYQLRSYIADERIGVN